MPSGYLFTSHSLAQFNALGSLQSRKAKNQNSRRVAGQDCRSPAKLCGEVCAVPVCIMLSSKQCCQSFFFMSTKLIPNVKYILCVNVYIIFDGHFLVECQILKFLYSPREGITYNARCQLLQLFFMAFHGIFFVDVAQVAHAVFYQSSWSYGNLCQNQVQFNT